MQIAKFIIAFVGLYAWGGLLFDAILPATARQHLYNPAWPPHAKLHNGQTMLFGLFNGTLTLLILFAAGPLTWPLFLIATATASAYWITLGLAPLFPGTAWTDPEFDAATPKPLGLHPQQLLAYILLALVALALLIAIRL